MVNIAKEDKPLEESLMRPKNIQKRKAEVLNYQKTEEDRKHEINIDLIKKAFWLSVGILGAIVVIWILYRFGWFGIDSNITSYILTSLTTTLALSVGFLFGANRK